MPVVGLHAGQPSYTHTHTHTHAISKWPPTGWAHWLQPGLNQKPMYYASSTLLFMSSKLYRRFIAVNIQFSQSLWFSPVVLHWCGKRCVFLFVVVEEGSRSAMGPSQSLFQQEEMRNHDFLHTTTPSETGWFPFCILFFSVEMDLLFCFLAFIVHNKTICTYMEIWKPMSVLWGLISLVAFIQEEL